jgi:response regulator of citrate/malate metabolism
LKEIRVLLLGLTRMVADIVREVVSQEDDVEIIASLQNIDDVESVAQRAEADLVITVYPPNKSELRRLDRALTARPGLRVLAIEDDGRAAFMYTLLPQTTQLGPLSPNTLIGFIRAPVRSQSASDR